MRRVFFYFGKIWPWVLLSLASIGGLGILVNLFHTKTEPVKFASIEAAKALAVHAAKASVTVRPEEAPAARVQRLQEFGWTVTPTDTKPTGAAVEVVDAQPLDPQIMSATQVLVPVKLWEQVKTEKTAEQKVQIANILILDDDGRLVVAGPPWLLPDDATYAPDTSSSKEVDAEPIRPLVDSFLKAFWSGGDVKNDIASGCELPKLAFQTKSVNIDRLSATKTGDKSDKLQVNVNLSATDPATGVPVPMQIILVLGQSVKDHWLVEEIYPF